MRRWRRRSITTPSISWARTAIAKQRKQLEEAFKKEGKKLDMGKSCVRFKNADDLPLPAIGKLIAAIPPAKYVEIYRASRKDK